MQNGFVAGIDTVQLAGKSVVIFGGTSGIGLAAAIQARAAGAEVIVIGRNPARAEAAAVDNGLAGWRTADMADSASIAEALRDIPRVDHLVMLGGSFVKGKVLEADLDHLHRAFDERVWGVIHTIRILGRRLSREGSITLVSGVLVDRPDGNGTALLASAAAAVEALGRGLAVELAPVRVNTLSPGPVETPILDEAFGKGRDEAVATMARNLPQQRIGTAAEAGAAVLFLMSNGWMNGAVLNLDGGARFI